MFVEHTFPFGSSKPLSDVMDVSIDPYDDDLLPPSLAVLVGVEGEPGEPGGMAEAPDGAASIFEAPDGVGCEGEEAPGVQPRL